MVQLACECRTWYFKFKQDYELEWVMYAPCMFCRQKPWVIPWVEEPFQEEDQT